MERLTVIGDDGNIYRADSTISDRDAWDRLAAYEDTGMEPEKINTMKTKYGELLCITHNCNPNRLRELAEADKSGRCVVLPCKVGDTVYVNSNGKVYECILDDVIRYNAKGMNFEIIRKFDGMCSGKQTVFLTREAAESALDAQK